MSYNIINTKYYTLEKGKEYFLDANIWIHVLAPQNKPSYKVSQYLKIFEDILNDDDIKIVVPSLLVSEVINRILKSVYFPEFLRKNGTNKGAVDSDYYKNIFRPSVAYKDSYETLTNDFIAYGDSIEFVNDGLGTEINSVEILENPPTNLDFNDNYYYNLALKRNYIIISDDKDFWVENIKVITQNSTLIEKQNKINIDTAKNNKIPAKE